MTSLFVKLYRLQVVFGFPAPPLIQYGTPPPSTARTDVSWCSILLVVLYHSPDLPPGYLGGTSGTAIQIQLSPRRELRRSEADILRIISAKFCSPVRKFLMERVNGQEGRGCEVARGVTSVALLRTRLYFSLPFSCSFGLLNGQKRTQIKRIGFLSDIH